MSEVSITPLVDGPLEVSGACRVNASDGTEIRSADKVYLCRCDGSHKKIGFVSDVKA